MFVAQWNLRFLDLQGTENPLTSLTKGYCLIILAWVPY